MKLVKKLGCLILATSLVVTGLNVPVTTKAKVATTYCKKKTTLSFKDSKGIRKLTVNGKKKSVKSGAKSVKVTFSKEGTYTVKVTNRKGKTSTKKIIVDKTKPTIRGVKNGKTYKNEVTVSASDKNGIKSFTINGQKINSPFKVTLKGAGSCTAIAKDKAGNSKTVKFSIVVGENGTPSPTSGAGVSGGSIIPGVDNSKIPDKTPDSECKHNWALAVTLKEPTCYSVGSGRYVCTLCHGTKVQDLPKTDHSFTEVVDDTKCCVKKVTCTEDGQYYKVCEHCGKISTDLSVVKAIGHKFEKKIATDKYFKESATEGHGDIYYLACSNCGAVGTETWDNGRKLSHTVHNFTDTSVANESNLASAATCTESAKYFCKCTGCDTFSTTETFIVGKPLGHNMQKTLIDPATCEHGNMYGQKCSRCPYEDTTKVDDGQKVSHDFSVRDTSPEFKKDPATCEKRAVYYYKCSHCGKSAEKFEPSKTFEDGELLPHNLVEVKSSKYYCGEATCDHGTEYYKSCSMCGESSKILGTNETFYDNDKQKCDFCLEGRSVKFDDATCQHGNLYYKKCKWCKTESDEEYARLRNLGYKEDSVELKSLLWDDGKKVSCQFINLPINDNAHLVHNPTCTEGAKFRPACKWCHQASSLESDIFDASKDSVLSTVPNEYKPLGHSIIDDVAHRNILTNVSATSDETYKIRCSREGCTHVDDTVHTGQIHTDVYSPAVYWNYLYAGGTRSTESGEWWRGNKMYFGALDSVANAHAGTLSININDAVNNVPNCFITKAYVVLDNWEGDRAEHWENYFKNGFSGNDGDNYIYYVYGNPDDGVISASRQLNLDFSNPAMRQAFYTGYCFAYIYTEDVAGNSSCVRTCNLFK